MLRRTAVALAVVVGLAGTHGCDTPKREVAHLSGKVTLNGKPVPTGFINFIPGVGGGEAKQFEIKDGMYNTTQGSNPGIYPGENRVYIQGFDGKVPEGRQADLWPKGKQVMNPYEFTMKVEPGTTTKDVEVPVSYGQNVKIVPTGDPKGPGEK
jgi:hypothetical protein